MTNPQDFKNTIKGKTSKWEKESFGLIGVCNYLKNTRRKGLRSKRRSSPCIIQVDAGADPAPELTDAYIRPRICRGVRGYPPPGNFEI